MKKVILWVAAVIILVVLVFNTEPQRGLGQSPNRALPYAHKYSEARQQIEAIKCVAYEIDALRKEVILLRKDLVKAIEPHKVEKTKSSSRYGPTYNPTVEEMEEWGMFQDDDLIGNGG